MSQSGPSGTHPKAIASTRDLLRNSSVGNVASKESVYEDAVDGLYSATNPSRFNEDLSKFVVRRQSTLSTLTRKKSDEKSKVFDDTTYDHENNLDDVEFESVFAPEDMRCLALVAHNHMKPAMRDFVIKNQNLLKKFRLTGTNTTMTMLREVFGDDPSVKYGPTCQSGPLGGDAELVALMVMEELGGQIFLQDPMDAHPHRADIDCLNRQGNVHDILQASNPSSAYGMMGMMRMALRSGEKGLLASFFETEYSPSVLEYRKRVRAAKEQASHHANTKEQASHHANTNHTPASKRMSAYELISKELEENAASAAQFFGNLEEQGKIDAPLPAKVEPQRRISMLQNIEAIKSENEEFRQKSGTIESKTGSSFVERGSSLYESIADDDFKSMFVPEEMRLLALVSHNHMLPALRKFIFANKNLLKKFVLTGNRDTMDILNEVYKGDSSVLYGPVCQTGALGGNAQLCALMCLEELGGLVFFQDPMDTHPHQVDIDCVIRQCNVHDIYLANNVSSAYLMMSVLRRALRIGNYDRIASFFETRKSPSVAEYKRRQQTVSDNLSARNVRKSRSRSIGGKNVGKGVANFLGLRKRGGGKSKK